MMKKLESWILHPFFFGLYPVIALLAFNISQVGLNAAVRSMVLACILAGLFFLIFNLVFRNQRRAALSASFSLLLFFTYGHVHNLIAKAVVAGIEIGKHRYLASLWIILFILGIWLIITKIKNPASWTWSLNILGLLVVILPIVQITVFETHSYFAARQKRFSLSLSMAHQLQTRSPQVLPDIYYIILDTYTRSDALQQAFGYDNSAFITALEQKGFYIPPCSQSNYTFTEASLTSSLNLQYLDVLSKQFSLPNKNVDDLVPYLQDNTLRQTLKDMGYKVIAFESGYWQTELRDAEIYLTPQNETLTQQALGGLNPFEAMLFRTTVGNFFYDMHFFPRGLENTLFSSAYLLHRDRILYEFSKLAEIPFLPGPKFVFVHILAPHNPFVFGPNGEILTRTSPFTLDGDVDAMELPKYIAGYVGQVNYLDQRTLETVDKILADSSTPPIIIIQGDHGSPRTPEWKTTILNAYYLPGHNNALYASITPVNSFRIIFDQYFGGKLPLLPDRSCRSLPADPFNCTYLTDPNPQCAAPAKP